MDAFGHARFAVAGHDTGMWIGYALAADHPGRVARLAVAETPLPGVSPSPPLFADAHLNDALWHFAFNRLASVNDQLAQGREEIYFGWQFATKAARPLPMPVLGIGGEHSLREQVADTMKLAAGDVQTLVVPGCGHHPAEETPEETLAALTAFLAPYRDEPAATHHP